jgi:hypothetical protein
MYTFVFNLLTFWYTVGVVFLMARFLYYTNRGKNEYLFTCVLLSAMILLICLLLSRVDLTLVFAIGIFALFGILGYRTIPILPREMTYIFLSAEIAVKNAMVPIYMEISSHFSRMYPFFSLPVLWSTSCSGKS